MPEESYTFTRKRKRKLISRRRELSSRVTSTKLWSADKQLFDDQLVRKHISSSRLLRDIVHAWALSMRLTGDDVQAIDRTVKKAHEKIVAEQVAPVRESVSLILDQLKVLTNCAQDPNGHAGDPFGATHAIPAHYSDAGLLAVLTRIDSELKTTREEINRVAEQVITAVSSQGELLNLNEAQLNRLQGISTAHYKLSGQSFATIWAAVYFIQRFIVEPTLRANPSKIEDPHQRSIIEREEARRDGLEMVRTMSEEFRYPENFEMVMVTPPEGQ